jgi:hypothetical protein
MANYSNIGANSNGCNNIDSNSSDFWKNGCTIQNRIGDIPNNYQFVNFTPKLGDTEDTGKCFGTSINTSEPNISFKHALMQYDKTSGEQELQSVPQLHTPESCKLNAELLKSDFAWKRQQDIMNGNTNVNYYIPNTFNQVSRQLPSTASITTMQIDPTLVDGYTPGLQFIILDGYHGDSDSMFQRIIQSENNKYNGTVVGSRNVRNNAANKTGKATGITYDLIRLYTGVSDIKTKQTILVLVLLNTYVNSRVGVLWWRTC